MTIESMQLDPDAVVYTDDEIVGKINAATDDITRAGCVDPSARPIESGEIGTTELATAAVTTSIVAPGVAKQNLDVMADADRGYVGTSPESGENKVVQLQRQADGKLDVDYVVPEEP